jgi:uncharacterized protein (DUF488 family)
MFDGLTIWTIGHSNRSIEDLLALLTAHQIQALADIRKLPGSKRYPHFNQEELSHSLKSKGIEYHWFESLGGRRKPSPHSKNTAWRNKAFQGYADYMESQEFASAIDSLSKIAREKKTVIMCSEAVWWSCHRSLVSDYMKVRGAEVLHIMGPGSPKPHPYTSAAQIKDGLLSYEGDEQLILSLN